MNGALRQMSNFSKQRVPGHTEDTANREQQTPASLKVVEESTDRVSSQRKIVRWVWAIWLGCVVIGSLLPASSPVVGALAQISDKAFHFVAYFVLAILPVTSFESRRGGLTTALLMAVLGLALEGGQTFSPGRTVEITDVIANNFGVLCGLLLGLPLRS